MDICNLLATSSKLIEVSVDSIGTVDLQWIGYAISWIFNLFSGKTAGIALGAIVFTLVLKTIVLPLDVYSRVKMKKQTLLMESMRPQMEKLQKQYANDQNMYNQKVLELQKQNGYNPLSACLPTIISLIIFMVVFSAFSQYSQYANLSSYNNMTIAYSNAVQEYVQTADGSADDKYFLIAAVEDGLNNPKEETDIVIDGGVYYRADASGNKAEDENGAYIVLNVYGYKIDYDKFSAYYGSLDGFEPLGADWNSAPEDEKNETVKDFVRVRARTAAAEYYRAHKNETSFPAATWWIGNVWYPDSMLNKEVPSFSDFRSAISRAAGYIDADYEDSYNEVTFDLQAEKGTWNGYFVLIVLAIGLMFLQQFISMRAQKASNELGSVDGQGAKTNKMMMIIMPIIFGFFSFFYSAAFSIYMITNTVYSLIATLIINKAVSVRFEKNSEKRESLRAAERANRKRLK